MIQKYLNIFILKVTTNRKGCQRHIRDVSITPVIIISALQITMMIPVTAVIETSAVYRFHRPWFSSQV